MLTLNELCVRIGLNRSRLLRALRSCGVRADARRGHALVWRAERLPEIRRAVGATTKHRDLLGPVS